MDVEIGSADGHDDSAERQGPVDSARNQVFLDWEVKEQVLPCFPLVSSGFICLSSIWLK